MVKRYLRPVRSRQFLIRRLHSLSGMIPVGVFLILHISTNLSIVASSPNHDLYQQQVDMIHSLGPLLVPVEILFILLPIAFHAAVGVKIWYESQPNVRHYSYLDNIRYTLQRTTGIATLLFILVHLYQMHWTGQPFRPAHTIAFRPDEACISTAQVMQYARWIAPFYVLGVTAACYHFANGIWTFLITWGITIGPRSQQIAGYACTGFGIALTVMGLLAVRGFARFDTTIDTTEPMHTPATVEPVETSLVQLVAPMSSVSHHVEPVRHY
ncbi:MAG: succinate dehydrogenase [Phycisphaerae bacterium]|nr:succinate dehydrogenase [Phycisphaerae bacterium]